MGLQPKKFQAVRLQLLPCSPLAGPAATKISSTQSAVAILQLSYWACHQTIQNNQIAVAALQPSCWACRHKISSSQIAVATLQLSCWACRPKNLKQSDCSCCPAALLLGLPPQKSQVRRVQLLSCSILTGPAT